MIVGKFNISAGSHVVRNGKEQWRVVSIDKDSVLLVNSVTGEHHKVGIVDHVGQVSSPASTTVSLSSNSPSIAKGKSVDLLADITTSGTAKLVIKYAAPTDSTSQVELYIDVFRSGSLFAGPEFISQPSRTSGIAIVGPDSRSELKFNVKRGDKVTVTVGRTGDDEDVNESQIQIINAYMRIE